MHFNIVHDTWFCHKTAAVFRYSSKENQILLAKVMQNLRIYKTCISYSPWPETQFCIRAALSLLKSQCMIFTLLKTREI